MVVVVVQVVDVIEMSRHELMTKLALGLPRFYLPGAFLPSEVVEIVKGVGIKS
jgi:hypothetical protein